MPEFVWVWAAEKEHPAYPNMAAVAILYDTEEGAKRYAGQLNRLDPDGGWRAVRWCVQGSNGVPATGPSVRGPH